MDQSNNIIINPKLRHVFGNVLRIAVPLVMRQVEVIDGVISTTDYDFHPSADYPVTMEFTRGTSVYKFKADVREGTIAYAEESGALPVGLYSIAVVCRDDHGVCYRFKERAALAVVDCTADAGIEDGVEYEVETQYLDGAVFFGAAGKGIEYADVTESQEPGGENTLTLHFTDGTTQTLTVLNGTAAAEQVNADWDEEDPESKAFIRNKPSIPAPQVNADWNAVGGVAEILNKPAIPSKTSDLVNDSNFTTKGMYMGVCETAAATAAKEATTDPFPTDEDGHPLIGTMIGIKFTVTDSCTTPPTINVNGTGAYGIMYGAGTVATKASSSYTGYAGNYMYYTFTEVNGTKYWMWVNRSTYQTNTDVEPGRLYGTAYQTGDYTMFRNTICGMTEAGRIEPLVLSSSTGTSKTRNTHGFRVSRFFYNASTTTNSVAANTVITSNILWLLYTSGYVDFRYSSNAGSTLTAHKPLYLVGTIGADGLFYLDTTWWTQTLPTTADGKVYVDIGMAYDNYRFIFTGGTEWYEYRNGAVRPYYGGQ